jgi:hypothetical protein
MSTIEQTTARTTGGRTRAALGLAALGASAALMAATVGTAHAYIHPGTPATVSTSLDQAEDRVESRQGGQHYLYRCALRRVATTFVRCDDLTGNGQQAPSWIEER